MQVYTYDGEQKSRLKSTAECQRFVIVEMDGDVRLRLS